jgi:hypothetical protein
MTKNWTTPGAQDDERVLEDFFRHVAPTIGELVTTLMRQGRPLVLIGAFFERAFDGKVSGGVGHRTELGQRVLKDPRFSEPVRAHIVGILKESLGRRDSIVLLVDQGEGLLAVGVRRERGELVSVS